MINKKTVIALIHSNLGLLLIQSGTIELRINFPACLKIILNVEPVYKHRMFYELQRLDNIPQKGDY